MESAKAGRESVPPASASSRAPAPLILALLASISPLLCLLLISSGLLPQPSGGRMWALLVVFPASAGFAASYALSRRLLGAPLDMPEAVRSAFGIDPAGWWSVIFQAAGSDGGLAERCLVECAGASAVGSALFLSIALMLFALSG